MAQISSVAVECSEKAIIPYYQPQPDMCQPTCVKVVLDSLSSRHKAKKLRLSLRTITKLCEYKRGLGSPSDAAIDNLNRKIKKSNFAVTNKVAPEANIGLLQNILESCCFPIVALSPKYFDEYKNRSYEVQEGVPYEHAVIIIKIDPIEEIIYFFDPWEKYAKKRLSSNELPPNSLIYPKFIKLWNDANRWVMWIHQTKVPAGGVKGQKRIEEWG